MSLENVDFQQMIHQNVTAMVEQWRSMGMSEEDIQDHFAKLYELGNIAAQLMVQEGGMQVQGMPKPIPYEPQLAQQVLDYFLMGINAGAIKAYQQKIGSNEKWMLVQQIALHVFEQAKQVAISTFGQENTPDVQISRDQIEGWVSQGAVEALLYYVGEYEKQNGPITQEGVQELPSLDALPVPETEVPMPEEEQEPVVLEPLPEPEPAIATTGMGDPIQPPVAPPEPVHHGASDSQHKFAAVGLLLATVPQANQNRILSAFGPEEQQWIQHYREPDAIIADQLDLRKVSQYMRSLQGTLTKLLSAGKPKKSPFSATLAQLIRQLPAQRVEKLFHEERPLVRGYVMQFTQPTHDPDETPYRLPKGVEECMITYLKRNFPQMPTTTTATAHSTAQTPEHEFDYYFQ